MPAAGRAQFVSRVVANVPLCREHYRLVLRLASFPPTRPGQFVQVACRDLGVAEGRADVEHDWQPGQPLEAVGPEFASPAAMLRRPFSLAGREDHAAGVDLHLIHRVVGVGTDWLARLRVGDAVGLLGPLGNTFTLPPGRAPALLVGGGVGIPPMLYLAAALAGRPAVAFAGALTRDLLPFTVTAGAPTPDPAAADPLYNVAEFARYGVPAVIATDDGSHGFRGFVTQALERYLEGSGFRVQGSVEGSEFRVQGSGRGGGATGTAAGSPPNPEPRTPHPPVIYTCGPEPMMRRVAAIAAARGLECQVAVERAMACGMGTCQSCCIRVRKPDPAAVPLPGRDGCWRLACTDGPVFQGSDLLW